VCVFGHAEGDPAVNCVYGVLVSTYTVTPKVTLLEPCIRFSHIVYVVTLKVTLP
jgi:hypothetical protein